jgi:uncharacterized membrane-anchored protein
MTMTIKLELAP